MLKKTITGCLFAAFTSMANADVEETGKITKIILEGNSNISVWLDGADATTECVGGSRWTLTNGQDGLFKEKVATLLAAVSAGKNIRLRHITAWGCGSWDSNTIYLIEVAY